MCVKVNVHHYILNIYSKFTRGNTVFLIPARRPVWFKTWKQKRIFTFHQRTSQERVFKWGYMENYFYYKIRCFKKTQNSMNEVKIPKRCSSRRPHRERGSNGHLEFRTIGDTWISKGGCPYNSSSRARPRESRTF